LPSFFTHSLLSCLRYTITGISFNIVLIMNQIDGFLNSKVGSFESVSIEDSSISLLSYIKFTYHPREWNQ
jgi:hypothetical protein